MHAHWRLGRRAVAGRSRGFFGAKRNSADIATRERAIAVLAAKGQVSRERRRLRENNFLFRNHDSGVHRKSRFMDAIDRKILAVLQENASLSVAEIGARVGLSSTPCWKRIQRLEADGVILKRVALVDQQRVGLPISVFVSVETGDHSQDWLDRFAKTVTAMPEVMEFYRMAGDVDYMLRVVVADIAGYDSFYKRLIAAIPLKNVTSRFAMEKIKATTTLPVPESK
jgi:Lrp/AsnC family transcriptional regulator, cysteine-sensing transcriptional activator